MKTMEAFWCSLYVGVVGGFGRNEFSLGLSREGEGYQRRLVSLPVEMRRYIEVPTIVSTDVLTLPEDWVTALIGLRSSILRLA